MLPDRVSNPGPLTYESGALPIALRGPAVQNVTFRILLTLWKCIIVQKLAVHIHALILSKMPPKKVENA